MSRELALQVRDLNVWYRPGGVIRRSRLVPVLHDISFDLWRVGQVLLADIVVRIVVRIAVGWGLGAACAVGVDVLQVPRPLTDAAVLNVAHGGNDGVVRGVRLGRGRE